MDDAGFTEAKICLSNDLDENVITQLLIDKTPVDSFGVGTKLVSSSSLGFVYKLCSMKKGKSFEDKMKLSSSREKLTLPGSNNVYRFFDRDGYIMADVISSDDKFTRDKKIQIHHPVKDEKFILEDFKDYKSMLTKIVDRGRVVNPSSIYDIKSAKALCQSSLSTLDDSHKRLLNPHIYKVSLSGDLKKKQDFILSKVFG